MQKILVRYVGWGENFELGILADNGVQLLFEYTPAAIRRGLELSPYRLKLRAEAYGDFPGYQFRLPGLIADALPDGWGLLLQDRLFRKMGLLPASISPLQRLALVNGNAMGALSFEPAQEEKLNPADVELFELAHEVRRVMAGNGDELLRDLVRLGGSPHGTRPKVLVNFSQDTGRMSNVEDSPGVPWLIKFQAAQEHKEVCAIEAMYAELATRCGIDMPETRYFDLGRQLSAFGIARFDRADGVRVPIQSLAAALNADFRMPSVDYTTLLRFTRFLTRDEREVSKAYLRCVFNVVFHNRDDHTKNFSYRLNPEGHWQLAPGYDLTFFEGPGGEHQMDICGESRAPSKSDLLMLATQGGVSRQEAEANIATVSEVAGRFKACSANYAVRRSTLARIGAAVEANCARMI